ncbi:MAG: nucleotidyltransferase domain-containing protein [Nanoarchaeota archaeon]|nr:nucleotidyltransferase domain-containing protein [Nanoarchaeota archaeon]
MNIYKLKFTRLQNEIFRLLCIKAGTTMNLREIARTLKVSPTAVGKAIKGLRELISQEKSKTINLVTAQLNRNSLKAIQMKRVENLKMLYESKLPEFLEERFPGCTIILFGSYSLGEDVMSSDVDIAIIGTKRCDLDLTGYSRLLERDINIQYYGRLNKVIVDLRENILNGITLSGGVEL